MASLFKNLDSSQVLNEFLKLFDSFILKQTLYQAKYNGDCLDIQISQIKGAGYYPTSNISTYSEVSFRSASIFIVPGALGSMSEDHCDKLVREPS